MGKLVIVEGEAMVRTESKAIMLDLFQEEFILDDSVKDENQALSVIRKGLLNSRLKKTVKNFVRARTSQVIEFKGTDKKSDNSELDSKLVEAAQLDCVPASLESYASDKAKEKALEKSIDNAKKRKKNAAKKAKESQVEDLGYVD